MNLTIFAPIILAAIVADAACHKRPATTPRQINFYDDNKLIDTDDFDKVPDSIRYVEVNGTKIAVSKVVTHTAGERRFIEQYSADGVMLRRTMQIKDPK